MSKDYGYFGDGLDGYVHYKQAFDDIFKEGNSLIGDDFLARIALLVMNIQKMMKYIIEQGV